MSSNLKPLAEVLTAKKKKIMTGCQGIRETNI